MPSPALTRTDPVRGPRGIVLMLHGGAQTGWRPVDGRSASLRRTTAMRDVLEPRVLSQGLSLWLLRFGVRGWNAGPHAEPSPVPEARWALDRAAEEHPGVPVVLLGHSMGARTAVHVAAHPSVVGVVGLAPWWEPGDPVRPLSGRHLVAGHGSRDRITSARMTRAYVERAHGVAASADFVDVGRLGHYMLHRPAVWNRFALRSTLDVFERSWGGARNAPGPAVVGTPDVPLAHRHRC
jgi:pimeloyl-ACP methyl ester carboxylesterase